MASYIQYPIDGPPEKVQLWFIQNLGSNEGIKEFQTKQIIRTPAYTNWGVICTCEAPGGLKYNYIMSYFRLWCNHCSKHKHRMISMVMCLTCLLKQRGVLHRK